jgi:adenylate cyclase
VPLREATVTNSEVSNELTDKPASDSEQPDKATSDTEHQPGKPPSGRNLKSRLRARLQLIGAALASFAAVGAVAGGLVGYWNVWKTVRTDVFQEKQKTQIEATARPDIAPRLSLVVLPFTNLNNDPEQDYFADGITTDLTTDLA